jgi:hypothetical protein
MTTRSPFDCRAVVLRVLGISVLCAVLFVLDRTIPSLLGFEYSRIQSSTLYLWLLALPIVGYSWVLLRSRRLISVSRTARWLVAVSIAFALSVAFALLTLAAIWFSA